MTARGGGLLFGTGGIPRSASGSGVAGGIRRLAELGLGCMEIEHVYGVRTTPEAAEAARQAAQETGLALSAHAPYYVNLNSKEPDKVEASVKRILDSARAAAACGGDRVVFHAAFFGGDPPESTFKAVKKQLKRIRRALDAEKLSGVSLRPELTGKRSQFGSPHELIRMSLEVEGVAPCLDLSHFYARDAGAANSFDDFRRLLDEIGDILGSGALEDLHIHLSGIEHSAAGETRHVAAQESAFDYAAALRALKACGARGRVICESPALEDDALLFQKKYRALRIGPRSAK
ncbi:MAG TPA: TIM barrel protein [bacterium]|nr:TIM barrel protein [bacterium]